MLFNSYQFMIFIPIVTIVFFIVPKKLRCLWLLLASYYFYASWNVKHLILLLFITAISYLCAIKCEKTHNKIYLILDIIISLLLLTYFKYFNFLLESINNLILNREYNALNIILPVGISFYIFQSIGYVVDVFRGTIKAEKSFIKYSLFISFFPQLVAGPIERSKNILSSFYEIEKGSKPSLDTVESGLLLMLYGFFMKIVLADRISPIVDFAFDNYETINSLSLLFGAVLFSIQIYCDFAGYSLIAIGCAKLFNINLMNNFKAPYFAYCVTDFWRRWHISLSTWFRDYVYIPLGGSRCKKVRNYINILITMLLSGLWHGAAWNFVVWGLLIGLIQIVEKHFGIVKETKNIFLKYLRILTNCVFITITWVFFRSNSFAGALDYLFNIFNGKNTFMLGGLSTFGINKWDLLIIGLSILILVVFDFIEYKFDLKFDSFMFKLSLPLRWICIIFAFCFVLVFGIYGPGSMETAFLYFQF